jgi:hypothetical protein
MLGLQPELEHLNNHAMIEALTAASRAAPDYFVEILLPWMDRVLLLSPVRPNDQTSFSSDELDSGWYDNNYPVGQTLVRSLTDALTQLARTAPETFRRFANHLALLPYNTPQRLLSHAYRAVPNVYAGEALHFLLADRRRFNLGEVGNRYDTRQLIKAIYPCLTAAQQCAFDDAVLSWTFDYRPHDLDDLAWRGTHQLSLLQAVPEALLTEHGRLYLHELRRKFPSFKVSDDPRTSFGGMVGSPIDSKSAQHMSDRAWLRAMRHYSGNVTHRDFLKGGARELSSVLQGLIKEQPERFYRLLEQVPDTVDDAYVTAYINGLAESNASAEWLFTVVRRFGRQPARQIGIAIYWALAKRSQTLLPNDIQAYLDEGVRMAPDDYEHAERREGKDLYNAYLNSERGTAFRAVMSFLRHHGDEPHAINRRWRLVEFASTDPSLVLRAGAIEELLYLMHLDRLQAVTLFEQLLNGHELLVCSHFADDFIYHALYKQFARVRPYIRLMMDAESEPCQQRGAELACIAAISPRALETESNLIDASAFAAEALGGNTAWRRGAARIYGSNIVDGPREQCVTALRTLLNDDDIEVRRHISILFHRLRAEHLIELQSFIEAFVASHSFQDQPHFFAEYLWENSTLFPELTLSLIDAALRNTYTPEANTGFFTGEEFVRSVLRIYTDPLTDDVLRQHAMDMFDRLMERFPGQSQQVLDEWDRR